MKRKNINGGLQKDGEEDRMQGAGDVSWILTKHRGRKVSTHPRAPEFNLFAMDDVNKKLQSKRSWICTFQSSMQYGQ